MGGFGGEGEVEAQRRDKWLSTPKRVVMAKRVVAFGVHTPLWSYRLHLSCALASGNDNGRIKVIKRVTLIKASDIHIVNVGYFLVLIFNLNFRFLNFKFIL